jgi:hypothetical protein
MRFTFTHSHAYLGGRVAVEDAGDAAPGGVVEFGDGVTILGAWRRDGADVLLDIPAYKTAKGTEIGPKRWRLAQGEDGIWHTAQAN